MKGIEKSDRRSLIDRFRQAREPHPPMTATPMRPRAGFEDFEALKQVRLQRQVSAGLGVDNPYFRQHTAQAGATSEIDGRTVINFSNYDYLGINGDARLNEAAAAAIETYGTSVSASRMVSGERPFHEALESALARVYQAEAAITFVSGHATNVATIGHLFGPRDLIVHDALIHNSALVGMELSGARRRSFAHNDLDALDALLAEQREQFDRVLIVVEGLYSMDGDTPDLARAIALRDRYGAFLMVDEAHALGVLGERGLGSWEACGINPADVDIWMGTLSKTLSSCGGYIAGSEALIEMLRYGAPGFVYSVGLAPPMAAAASAALSIMQAEPERVARLQANGQHFLKAARERSIDTGYSEGYAVIPAILGSSIRAVRCSNQLLEAGVNVQPIIHPAVEERRARLRFFLSAAHEPEQIDQALDAARDCA